MTTDQLAERIFQDAQRYAKSQGKRLGIGAEQDFRNFAQRAAMDLAKDSDAELDERVKAMNAVFERLIDEMIVAAAEIPQYEQSHPGNLGEDTLRLALSKLCPLFPFC